MSLPRRLGKAGRRWLLLFHRWAGIAAGLFFALWIGSGLVMLYVPFPALTGAERLDRLAPIAWERVAVAPDDALRAGGLAGVPAAFALEMRGAEPVYRIADRDGRRATVSARTGERLGPLSPRMRCVSRPRGFRAHMSIRSSGTSGPSRPGTIRSGRS